MDTKTLGRLGEDAAARYLEAHGFHVTARNLHIGHAEIDLIAENDGFLLFVEVKTRRQVPGFSGVYGVPAAAVGPKKQAILTAAAENYLREHESTKTPRIDVIEVYADPNAGGFRTLEVRHIENAVRKTGKFSRSSSRYRKD